MCWLGLPATAEVLNAVVLLSTSGWCACELASNCWCAPWLSNIGWGALYSGFPPPGDVPEFILRIRNYNVWACQLLVEVLKAVVGISSEMTDWACQQLLKCSSFFWLPNYCWCALSGVYILNFYALYDFEPFSLQWLTGLASNCWSAPCCWGASHLRVMCVMASELSNNCWCARSWVYILNVYAFYDFSQLFCIG